MDALTKPNKTYWLAQHTLSWNGGVDAFRIHLSKQLAVMIKLEVQVKPTDNERLIVEMAKFRPALGFDVSCNIWDRTGLGIVWFSWNEKPKIQFWEYSNRNKCYEAKPMWGQVCSILEWRATRALNDAFCSILEWRATRALNDRFCSFEYDRVSELRPEQKPRFL